MLVLLNSSLVLFLLGSVQAQDLDDTVQTESRINQDAVTSQQRVTGLAQQTQDLLAEYRSVVRETESLRIYDDNLERVVTDQGTKSSPSTGNCPAWK